MHVRRLLELVGVDLLELRAREQRVDRQLATRRVGPAPKRVPRRPEDLDEGQVRADPTNGASSISETSPHAWSKVRICGEGEISIADGRQPP